MPETHRVPDEVVATVRDDGAAVVESLLAPEQLAAAREHLHEFAPTAQDYARRKAAGEAGLASHLNTDLPFAGAATGLNDAAVSPAVVDYAERRLGTTDIQLNQVLVMAKYPGEVDFDQPLHVDYANNLLHFPREGSRPTTANLIIYLSDVDTEHGPTYYLPFGVTGNDPQVTTLDRTEHADWYAQERPAVVRAGGALLYTMSTFHRGSRYRASDGARFTLHLVFRAAGDRATTWHPWARAGSVSPTWPLWFSRLTPRQRCLFGFPAPGDPYWDERTLAGVGRRYPQLDLAPYREAATH